MTTRSQLVYRSAAPVTQAPPPTHVGDREKKKNICHSRLAVLFWYFPCTVAGLVAFFPHDTVWLAVLAGSCLSISVFVHIYSFLFLSPFCLLLSTLPISVSFHIVLSLFSFILLQVSSYLLYYFMIAPAFYNYCLASVYLPISFHIVSSSLSVFFHTSAAVLLALLLRDSVCLLHLTVSRLPISVSPFT